jgi:hypothetical protein
MPIGLDPVDRKLLFGALALMLLMTVTTATLAPSVPAEQSPIPLSYSASPGGALAAYTLLEQLRYPVMRWEDPPARLPSNPTGAVLILAEPTSNPTIREGARLRSFIAGGGSILFCGRSIPAFFPEAQLNDAPSSKLTEVSPDFPSAFAQGAKKIRIRPQATWKSLSPNQIALYGDESAPVAVVWRIGRGELLWWAAATPLTNAGINQADNLTLVLNAMEPHSGGSIRRIYWDEYFHGGRSSLWSYVERTPLKWVLVQCGLLTAAILFSFGRRSGPISPLPPVSRLSPLEFVETMGGFYQRARATSVPIGVAHGHLRMALTRRLRLSSVLSDRELAQAAEQRLGWDGAGFASVLERAAAAHDLRPKDALHLVRNLAEYSDRLVNYSPTLENK